MKKLLMILALLSVPAGSLLADCCPTCPKRATCTKSCCPKKSTCGCPRPEVEDLVVEEVVAEDDSY